jgi:small subunit ribosomal protein S17
MAKKQIECNDKKCPFHGTTRLRGLKLEGTIIKTDTHRSATFEKDRKFFIGKYERYEKRRTRLHVHNPSCVNAQKGDKVSIMECKPLSKTKKFVIIKVLGHDVLFKQKEEALEEAKVRSKKKEEPAAEESKEQQDKV